MNTPFITKTHLKASPEVEDGVEDVEDDGLMFSNMAKQVGFL